MQKIFFLLLLFLGKTIFSTENQPSCAITYYGRESGRLGDLLRLYVKTKWMAFRHNVPLLHKPFPFSDQFEFHYKEQTYNPKVNKFKKVIKINHDPDYIDPKESKLYEVGYYPFITTPWGGALENSNFIQEIKTLIQPHIPLAPIVLPKGVITTVALHVRKGGGADIPLSSEQIYRFLEQVRGSFADRSWPLKFPPDQYYIDQINRLSTMLSDEPLYIYVFTDDQNPQKIIDRYEKHIKSTNVIFDCRKSENYHAKNVIEDFFAMTQFDYMIRGASHYSEVADIIGNHKMVIYPYNFKWEGNRLIITQVCIVHKENNKRSETILPNYRN